MPKTPTHEIPIRPSAPPTGTRGDQRHGAIPEDHPDRPGALELPTDEAVADEGEVRLDPEEEEDDDASS